jgi:hypothetical protein
MVCLNIKVITPLYLLLHEGLKPRHSAQKQFDFKGYESNQRQCGDSPHPRCAAVLGIISRLVSAVDRVTQNGTMEQTHGLRRMHVTTESVPKNKKIKVPVFG